MTSSASLCDLGLLAMYMLRMHASRIKNTRGLESFGVQSVFCLSVLLTPEETQPAAPPPPAPAGAVPPVHLAYTHAHTHIKIYIHTNTHRHTHRQTHTHTDTDTQTHTHKQRKQRPGQLQAGHRACCRVELEPQP